MDATQTVKQTAFVSMETEADQIKRNNLHLASACIGFVWMLFHFTVVFFFTLNLGSPLLVGLFLGLGNVIALALDVPVSILGRFFASKKLFLFAAISMLAAGLIFLKFIYASSLFVPDSAGGVTTLLGNFLDSTANLLLLALAAGLYGFTKEVNDLTTLSYILNNSDPSEYSSIISKNNIYTGAGALFGLLASGFILSFSPTAAILTLIVFVIMLIFFIFSFFDSSDKTISLADITKLKVIARRPSIDSLKEYAIGYVAKADFAKLAAETKLIFLRPQVVQETGFDPKKIIPETIVEINNIKNVLVELPRNKSLYWFMAIVLCFGFWDTFAASFLIDYLSKLPGASGFGYALLGILAIPAFVTQEFFIKMSRKLGVFLVAAFGLLVSGGSLMMFGIVEGIPFVILFGLLNSLGYAAGMGLAQGGFLDLYNAEYAKKKSLSEIDSNASASPMKMILNVANVIGLTLGGFMLAILGFGGFFFVFGMILIGIGTASFVYRSQLTDVR